MSTKGLFISMEGLDGSGKSTQIGLIKEYAASIGFDVLLTREPGGTRISEQIRQILLDPNNKEMSDKTELILYAAARAQLVHQIIRPALDEGKVVISDRFVDSNFAYQGYGRGIPLSIITKINEIAIGDTWPDLTFFLDIPAEESLRRRMAATQADRLEQEAIEFHLRVYNGYKDLANKYPERFHVINAQRPINDIFDDIKLSMETILNYRRAL